ncbi:uroporphyrinogen decarboxylase [Acidiferrobacter sp.]|uniref:uroporphyrinogen decarboxylase n=1 Tax=Acidiferrobacter sp. TaxID=1872107 RepID=UPI00260C8440|nr:uroporphyrinogen decarboxylase [Acidiferrobacter sp.]
MTDVNAASDRGNRLLRALLRMPVDMTPVWLMRQAGRYLPEYRALRAAAGSFLAMCQTPELACEVTLQPVRRFSVDAAILFSDILTIPDAMGLGLSFVEGEGPRFQRPIRDRHDVAGLRAPDPTVGLHYVLDTVSRVRRELAGLCPLIGFSGSPWTLATYMVEGQASEDFRRIKGLLFTDPATLATLLAVLVEAVTSYLNAQIEAGAQAVMIFDTWGGSLAAHHFLRYSRDPMAAIISNLNRRRDGARVPVVVFTKGGGCWLQALVETGCDAVGIDWTTSLAAARAATRGEVALQGNLDPMALYAPPERLKAEVQAVLADFGEGQGHIFNLGHGVRPDVDPDQVGLCIDAVHAASVRSHP